jgi:uncharacterized protein
MRYMSILIPILLIAASSPAQAFDCARASTETEKLICADSKLKQADDDLGRAWSKARSVLGETEFKMLRQIQRAWLKTRDARCGYGSDAERIDCLMQQTHPTHIDHCSDSEIGTRKRCRHGAVRQSAGRIKDSL